MHQRQGVVILDQLINCGMLIDGNGDKPIEKCSIRIRDGKIIKINSNLITEKSTNLINWEKFVVIPGLFDCHDHINEDFNNEYKCEEDRKVISSLLASENCSNILKSGITTFRDAGAKYAINIKVRDAIKKGLIHGPDIIAAGNRIARTGFPKWRVCLEVDGIDEVRRAVRLEQKKGADFIKLMATGVAASGPTKPEYSKEEIKVVIEEAHSLGLKVGVHACGGSAATFAIQSDVDVIEHGTYLTDNDFKEMARKNISLVVTLSLLNEFNNFDDFHSVSSDIIHERKLEKSYQEFLSVIKKAKAFGILFSLGGDHHHGDPAGLAKALKDCGFTALEAITVLTKHSAKVCNVDDLKGTIEEGKQADIVALKGSPLKSLKELKKIMGVIKNGTQYI